MFMRVIAGEYRGRMLKSPVNLKTRPTSDRLRETLFNILQPKIDDETRFLDLCAGTGAIGIEAISRGVKHSTFVDKSRRACGLIKENLAILEISKDQSEVFCDSAEKFIAGEISEVWDIVFFDPPYETDYSLFLHEFGTNAGHLLSANGILIAEHHAKKNLPDAIGEIRRWRILKQGETQLSFYENK